MKERYKIVYQGGEGEIVEKKSRFIAEIRPVESEEEATAFIAEVKKKYWDARHHCWAYAIGDEQVQERCSDDGEPSGTAGKPILEVIRGNEIHNVLIVVTRYFGGTLLGTGGLVRAYTQAAQEGIAVSTIVTKTQGYKVKIQTDYTTLGKIQYLLGQKGVQIIDSVYQENVEVFVYISKEEETVLQRDITEVTNGQTVVERIEECSFANVEGQMIQFDN